MRKDELLALSKFISIVSHANGRIRFRLSPEIKKVDLNLSEEDLKNFFNKLEGVKTFKLNPLIASLTITYDPNLIAPNLWEDLCQAKLSSEFEKALENIL